MSKEKVLNLRPGKKESTDALKAMFADPKRIGEYFTVIDLGPEWANQYDPLEAVTITIGNENKVTVIGRATVVSTKKTFLAALDITDNLDRNIGAKTTSGIVANLRNIHGDVVRATSVVSVLSLAPTKTR